MKRSTSLALALPAAWLALSIGSLACQKETPATSPPTAAQTPAPGQAAGPTSPAAAERINPRVLRRFQPVDGAVETRPSPQKVALGRMLFFDKRLSRGHDIACNSCHDLAKFGADGKPTSPGSGGGLGTRNSPTVFNAATHIAQFWDGRAADVETQATGPILNPREMAMPDEKAVVAVLSTIPAYLRLFDRAFPDEKPSLTLAHVGIAIGSFVRGLVTTSRWDKFIAGDSAALTAEETYGLHVFVDTGCMTCHTGPQVGGTMFQRVGALLPWPNQKDRGRIEVTKAPADEMVFKVPTLKNVAETGPYFHDGSVADLETAIKMMGRHQLGIELETREVKAIAAWLRSMTGKIDPVYAEAPTLPEGGPSTARASPRL